MQMQTIWTDDIGALVGKDSETILNLLLLWYGPERQDGKLKIHPPW
jgi:hypothetical protein